MSTDFTRAQFDAFLTTLKFAPNPFQLAVLESIAFGSGNIVVSALAGSGKTSLLMQTAHLLNAMGDSSASYIAFNVKIRDAMNQKLPRPFSAINTHSLGMRMLQGVNPRTRVDNNKYLDLAEEKITRLHIHRSDQYQKKRALAALVSKAMLNNADMRDENALIELAARYRIEGVFDPETGYTDLRLVREVAGLVADGAALWKTSGAVSFDDQLYLPVTLNLQPAQYNYIFVDEMQDLSILQQELVFRSVKPGGRFIGVGDKKQAIYGWSGADAVSFDRIIERAKATVLPLNICYRCPTKIIQVAQEIVPELQAAPEAKEGVIDYIKPEALPSKARPGAMVMCRLNAPLISAYFQFIANRVPARVMGKDIEKDLISTLDRIANFDGFRFSEMSVYLEKHREQQTAVLMQRKNSETQIEALNDKVNCLLVCVENFNCPDLDCLKSELKALFGDENKDDWSRVVALCTVHKAKGLEAEETFILRPEKIPLTYPGQSMDEFDQEKNLLYVAITRSLHHMTVVGEPGCLKTKAKYSPVERPLMPAKPVTPVTPVMPVIDDPKFDVPIESKPPLVAPIKSPAERITALLSDASDAELDRLIELLTLIRSQRKETRESTNRASVEAPNRTETLKLFDLAPVSGGL